MEEIVYLSIRFGCTAYLLYKVWKQKERIGKICDLLYTPRNRPQAEKDNGEPGNAQDVMGATRFVYLDENAGKTVAPYMSQNWKPEVILSERIRIFRKMKWNANCLWRR